MPTDRSCTGDETIRAAAGNNAQWCQTMCRAHGIDSTFDANVWTAATRTPMFHPDAVTLRPAVHAAAVVDAIDLSSPGATVKDSFGDLDLSDHGFRILFQAHWIFRAPGISPAPGASVLQAPERQWDRVSDAEDLADWALAWDDGAGHAGLFRPGLLADPDTWLLADRSGGRIVGGAIATRSPSVVGISNVFTTAGVDTRTWAGLLRTVDLLLPGLPLVGYERGSDLAVAQQSGFAAIGPLRVWLHDRR